MRKLKCIGDMMEEKVRKMRKSMLVRMRILLLKFQRNFNN